MNPPSQPQPFLAQIARLGLAARCGLVTLAVAIALAIAGALAFRLHEGAGVAAAGVAAGVCLLGSIAALTVSQFLQGPEAALRRVLASMALRMFVPLAFCLVVAALGGPLAEAGCVYYVLVFYLVTLAVDTVLALPHDAATKRSS